MFGFIRKSIGAKVGLSMVSVAVLPVLVLILAGLFYIGSYMEKTALDRLAAVRDTKSDFLEMILEDEASNAVLLAQRSQTANALNEFDKYVAKTGKGEGGIDLKDPAYLAISAGTELDHLMDQLHTSFDSEDLILVSGNGLIAFTFEHEKDLGTSLKYGPYRNTALAKLWAKVTERRGVVLGDMSYYEPSGHPTMFAGAPVIDRSGKMIGVAVVQIDLRRIGKTLIIPDGLGETSEVVLVGQDLQMRSDSRFEKESTILKKKIETEATHAIFKAGSDKSRGTLMAADYRGEVVLEAFAPMGLDKNKTFYSDFDWGIIAKVDKADILKIMTSMKWMAVLIALIIAVLAALAGYRIAKMITRPLVEASNAVTTIARGDLTVNIKAAGEDEIGRMLADSVVMVDNLRDMVRVVADASAKMSQSMAETSSALDEQVAVSTEQASSVTEVTATMEEFSGAIGQIANHGIQVSESAKKIQELTREGAEAVESVTSKMRDVNQENQRNIARIIDLGKKSEEITKVMTIINNIADQTKLIAFNAALEASSAGEYGRRFGVVAAEIRRLANSVMESTGEIESKINEIKQSVNSLVVASEKSSKGVEECLQHSIQASEQFDGIVRNVESNTDVARQIAVTTQQQKVASEQVVKSVKEISSGSNQISIAMRQVSSSGKELALMAQKLQAQVGKFKLPG